MMGTSSKRRNSESQRPWRHFFIVLVGILVLCTAASAVSPVWTRTANGSADSSDRGRTVVLAPNGDVYVVGYKSVTGQSHNIWIRKYSAAGATKWTRTIDGPASGIDQAHGATVDGSGNLFVVGTTTVSGEESNIWIRKFTSSGTKLWTRTVDGPANDFDGAYGAAVDSTGNLYVVGNINKSIGDYDIWIRKYNTSGTKLWTRTVDGPANDYDVAYGAAVDSTGKLYVVGTIFTIAGNNNIWIRKYNSSGTKLWTRTFDGPASGYDFAYGAAVDNSDNLFVVGTSEVTGEGPNIWIRKYSSAGTKRWTRTVNGSADGFDVAEDVAVDANGAVYVIGRKELVGGSNVAWIRKYSTAGVKRWTTTYAGPDDDASGYGIIVNSANRFYTTGSVWRTGQSDNIWVRKYQQ